MKEITTVGVDLAKSVFTVHGVDATGRTMLRCQGLCAGRLRPQLGHHVRSGVNRRGWRSRSVPVSRKRGYVRFGR
jgi:hypothetical protein